MFSGSNNKLKFIVIISYITITIIINFILIFEIGDQGNEKLKWVEHTHKVITETKDYLSAMKDTETGQRGYLLTMDKAYLEPYYDGLNQAQIHFSNLSNLTIDNQYQVVRLETIEVLMQLKFKELKETIETENYIESIKIVKRNEGKKYMDDIRGILLQFANEETNLLNQRKKELKNINTNNLFIIGVVISLFLLGLFYFLYRNLNQQYKINFLEEQKELFRQLEEQKKALDEHSIVAITDIKGIITYVNDKLIQISGYSKKELIGSNHSLLNSGIYKKEFWKDMYKTISNKKIWKYEICNKAKDGSLYWVDTTIFPILDSNSDIKNYIVIRTDITKRKINEIDLFEAKEKAIVSANTKSEFLANMSHEIRTPLNAILGFIGLLKDESVGKSLEYVNIIDTSSKSLLKIIEDILDFSKIESGKLDIDKIDFNVKSEFEIITHLFDLKCSEKNISLTLNIDKSLPQVINSDPLRIKQIISNLISNAIKFTDNGKKIIVDIRYKKNFLNVYVKDEGKGIAKDKLSHIFEAFGQEDSSTTREYGGTGLGLSISSELTKLLGGELKVKSEIGIGSEFYFSIPASIGKEIIKIEKNRDNISFENKKILLAEDNKANQMFMKVVFKKLKLEFDIACDGLEAIESFKNNKYDIILMDENMPNMNGIEATKNILEIEKENNLVHTPIISLTANALKGDRERFLSAGMDEYMTKPVNMEKLNTILERLLAK